MPGKYDTEVDPNNKNTSQALIVELTGPDKRVLDVGTATGYVAKVLKERGCTVTGIELDPEAAQQAEKHCERVIVGDVEKLDLEAEFGEELFDVIIFGDVLEHLKEPELVLKRVKPFLSPGGYVVASIPNIAHGSVRLALLQGSFQYRPLGLLDETHLKFFTRESIEQLFDSAGYAIDILERIRVGIFNTEIELDKGRVSEEVLEQISADPESETYQFVLTAYPQSSPPLAAKLNRLRFLEERLEQRDRVIYELSRKLRNMEELQRQLEDRNEHLARREREVSELVQEVAKRNRRLANLEERVKRLNQQVGKLRKKGRQ